MHAIGLSLVSSNGVSPISPSQRHSSSKGEQFRDLVLINCQIVVADQENCWTPGQKETWPPPPILQIMILKLIPPRCVITRNQYSKNELMNCDLENSFLLVYLSRAPGDRPLTPPLSGPVWCHYWNKITLSSVDDDWKDAWIRSLMYRNNIWIKLCSFDRKMSIFSN